MAKGKHRRRRREALSAELWVAFGAGAGMNIDASCADAARKLGYYKNVRKRWKRFKDPQVRALALKCSRRAGKNAAKLAIAKGKSTITAAEFNKAAKRIERVMNRTGMLGEICA